MNYRYAGFFARAFALLIDEILLGILISILYFVASNFGEKSIFYEYLMFPLMVLISIGYFVIYQHKYGQTLGKKIIDIKVITYDGKTPSILTLFLREVIGKSISGFILNIGYFMSLWDGRKQALHDKIANTYVITLDNASERSPTPPSPAAEAAAGGASAGEAA